MGAKGVKTRIFAPIFIVLQGTLNSYAVFNYIFWISAAGGKDLVCPDNVQKAPVACLFYFVTIYNIGKLACGGVNFLPFYFK